jgi:hypothetical protein
MVREILLRLYWRLNDINLNTVAVDVLTVLRLISNIDL